MRGNLCKHVNEFDFCFLVTQINMIFVTFLYLFGYRLNKFYFEIFVDIYILF
jgi:hypothetical protein